MDTILLGKEIKRLRKKHKISQKQLADGICTQPTISGVEAGKVYPSLDILYSISLRLKVNLDYFIKILLNETQHYIEETVNHIEHLMKNLDYQDAFDISSFELKQKSRNLGYRFDQLIKWTYIVTSYNLKKMDWEQCIIGLNNLIDQSHPLFGQDFEDMRIKNSIAIIYAEKKEYDKSLKEYNEILSFKDFLYHQPKFYIKVHYNISKLYFLKDYYSESLYHVKEGIKISLENEDMSSLGQLYFQQGLCFERLNYENDIKECYKKSYLFFKLLNRENFIQMVLDKKGQYLID
ncbi:helix-turn-helix domain-containing protein [Bacillus salitolerans]|uniref:Helix-turn-helix domain-containing protein n=1 Tax=Bacillus salitolerans TaxID=1437434 RepID=A0ABW4LYQ2_9BACI